MGQPLDVAYIQVIITVVEFNYVHTGFLPAGSVLSDNRGIEAPNQVVETSVSYYFCLMYFDALLLGTYTLRIILS